MGIIAEGLHRFQFDLATAAKKILKAYLKKPISIKTS
jgi:hypothetical protein